MGTRRGGAGGGLMLLGVASSKLTAAMEQLEEARAVAAAASPQRPSLSMELPLSPGAPIGAGSRPTSALSHAPAGSRPASAARPATPSLLGAAAHAAAGFLMSLRPGARRPTHTGMEQPGTPHTPAGGHGQGTAAGFAELPGGPPVVPVMVLPSNRFKVAVTRATGGRVGIYGEDFSSDGQAPSKAAMAAAAAAAAFMREIPYRKPVRRCCSARQLMATIRGGADDPPHEAACNATMVAGRGGGFPARNNSHVHGRRPNGAAPGAVSSELGGAVGLPTPKFGGAGGAGGVVANLNLTAAPAYGGVRGGLHLGKHGAAGEDGKGADRHSVFALFQHHHQGAKEQRGPHQHQHQQQQRRESGAGQASCDTIDALSALLPPPVPPALPPPLPMPSATSFGAAAGAAPASPAAEAAPGGSEAQPSSGPAVDGSVSQEGSGSRPASASSLSAAAAVAAPPQRGSSDGGVGMQVAGASGSVLSATASRRVSGTGGFTPALGAIQEDERDGSPDTPDRRPRSAQQGAAAAGGGGSSHSAGGSGSGGVALESGSSASAAGRRSRPGSGVRSEAQVPLIGDAAGTAAAAATVNLSPHPSAAVNGDDPATPLLLTRKADGDGDGADGSSHGGSLPTAAEAAGAVPLVPPAAPGALPRPPSAAALASLGSLGGRAQAGEVLASLGSAAHTKYGSAASLVSLAAGVSSASPAASRPGTAASGGNGDGGDGAMPPPPPPLAPLPPPPAPPPVRVSPPGYDDGTDGGWAIVPAGHAHGQGPHGRSGVRAPASPGGSSVSTCSSLECGSPGAGFHAEEEHLHHHHHHHRPSHEHGQRQQHHHHRTSNARPSHHHHPHRHHHHHALHPEDCGPVCEGSSLTSPQGEAHATHTVTFATAAATAGGVGRDDVVSPSGNPNHPNGHATLHQQPSLWRRLGSRRRSGHHNDHNGLHNGLHNGHKSHGSDSESDGEGNCWPPCLPQPWAARRVLPLPQPVKDLADGLGERVEKAKSVLFTAAGSVADKADRLVRDRSMNQVQEDRMREAIEKYRNTGFEDTDAASFFWFRNPRVIAYLFNWAYYENALSLALLIFSLIMGYQGVWVFKGVPFWAVIVLLVADLAILVHSCLYVLPLYALITPVGSHCPKDVLKRAIKAGVFTKQTAVIARALNLQLKASTAFAKALPAAPKPRPNVFARLGAKARHEQHARALQQHQQALHQHHAATGTFQPGAAAAVFAKAARAGTTGVAAGTVLVTSPTQQQQQLGQVAGSDSALVSPAAWAGAGAVAGGPPPPAASKAGGWGIAERLTQGQPKPPAAAPPPATQAQGKGEATAACCLDSGDVPLLPMAPSAAAVPAPLPPSQRPVGEGRAATPSSTGSAAPTTAPSAPAAPHPGAVRRTFAPPAADEQPTQHLHQQQQQQPKPPPPKAPGFLGRLFGRGANKGANASHPAAPAAHHHHANARGRVSDEVIPFDPSASLSASLPRPPGSAARQGAWAPGSNGAHQPPTAHQPPPHGHVEVSGLSASSSAFGDTLTGGAMAALMEGMYRGALSQKHANGNGNTAGRAAAGGGGAAARPPAGQGGAVAGATGGVLATGPGSGSGPLGAGAPSGVSAGASGRQPSPAAAPQLVSEPSEERIA